MSDPPDDDGAMKRRPKIRRHQSHRSTSRRESPSVQTNSPILGDAPADAARAAGDKRVVVIYDEGSGFDWKVVQGVANFAGGGARWQLFLRGASGPVGPSDLEWCAPHGIMGPCRIFAGRPNSWGLPAVAYGGASGIDPSSIGCGHIVASDNETVGRIGAEHLLERGFRHLAFCGYSGGPARDWSAVRANGFARRASDASVACATFSPDDQGGSWLAIRLLLASWVRMLTRPVGIMAANDRRARQLLEASQHLGIKVPEEMAVIGVDDDPFICENCQPTISSVDQGARRIGQAAAALLGALMEGEPPPPGITVIPPIGVVKRRSSDTIAVADKIASAALAYVRLHACEGIKIADVADALGISRSTIQMRFREAVGRTLHHEIQRVRIETAQRLLATTNLPIKQVSDRSGFRTVQHMSAVFRKVLDATPAACRREARSGLLH